MATESELLALLSTQGAELETLRKAQQTAVIDAALMGSISGIVHSGHAASQVVELLRDKVAIINDNGKQTVVGPGYKPVSDYVRDTLASEGFAHFRNAAPTGAPTAPRGFAELPIDAQKNFGHAIVAQVQANRAEQGDPDPRMNPARAFGLGRCKAF